MRKQILYANQSGSNRSQEHQTWITLQFIASSFYYRVKIMFIDVSHRIKAKKVTHHFSLLCSDQSVCGAVTNVQHIENSNCARGNVPELIGVKTQQLNNYSH